MDIVYQIQFRQNQFNRQEARVAKTILENPTFASTATIDQLAARAGVSKEIVGNFAKSLGCADLNDFIYRMREQQPPAAPAEIPVAPPVLGNMDVAFASASAIGKLPGVSAAAIGLFARSIGAEEDIGDIIYQIRAQLNQLSQQEAKVAQAILDDVPFASSATIEQLAAQAGVSPATITRFAKSIGCDDIRDLRMKLAQASAVGSRYLPAAPPVPDSIPLLWRQTVAEIEQTLHRHLLQFEARAFTRASEILNQSQGIYLFSTGSSATLLANDLQHRLMRAGYPAFAYHDAEMMRITAANLGPRQAVLALSMTGENPDLLAAARIAGGYGAPVIAMVPAASALATLAGVVLPLNTDSVATISQSGAARYGLLLTLDLLLTQLALQAPEERKVQLERARRALDDMA